MGADEPARAQKSKRGVNVSIVWPSSLLDEVHLLRHDSEYFCEAVLLWGQGVELARAVTSPGAKPSHALHAAGPNPGAPCKRFHRRICHVVAAYGSVKTSHCLPGGCHRCCVDGCSGTWVGMHSSEWVPQMESILVRISALLHTQ